MKLITRNTGYAIRALCFIAKCKEEKVSASELVRNLKIPRPFLRKILQILNKRGILKSSKGQGGGFMLAVPPDRIYLIDLIEVFQGPLKLIECLFRKRICTNVKTCILKKEMDILEKQVISELRLISVATLLRKDRKTHRMSFKKRVKT